MSSGAISIYELTWLLKMEEDMKKTRRKFLTVVLILTMALTMSQAAFADSTGLADGDYKIEVSTGENMFKVVDCSLKVKDGKMTAEILLSGTGYYALYKGTADEALASYQAKDESQWIKYEGEKEYTSDSGQTKTGRLYTVPVDSIDEVLKIVSISQKYYDAGNTEKMFYERTLTFDKATLVPADGEYEISVDTGEKMFKVVDAVLKVKDGKMTAVVTLSGTGYTYLYAGQVNDSNTDVLDTVAEEDRIPVKAIVTNDEGKEQAQYEIPVASLDTPLAFGSFSANKQVWYARTMTFQADTLAPVAQDPAPVNPAEPEDPKNDPEQTPQDNAATPDTKDDTDVPKTGDNMGLGLMMLLVVGGAGSAAVFYKKRNVA